VSYLRLHTRSIVSVEREARPGVAEKSASVFGIGFVFFGNVYTNLFCSRCNNPPESRGTRYRLAACSDTLCHQLGVCNFLCRLSFLFVFYRESSIFAEQFNVPFLFREM
jgi:hypothetical protein